MNDLVPKELDLFGQTGERSRDPLTMERNRDFGRSILLALSQEFVKSCMSVVPKLLSFVIQGHWKLPNILNPFKTLVQRYIPSFARVVKSLQIFVS